MMWEYRLGNLRHDGTGHDITYVNTVSGFEYIVPHGMMGNEGWEQQIHRLDELRYGNGIREFDVAVAHPQFFQPTADVAQYLGIDHQTDYRTNYRADSSHYTASTTVPTQPKARSNDDMMRLITKLSLLWEEQPGMSLSVLVNDLCRENHFMTAQDEVLEATIDRRMAKLSARG